MGLTKKHLENAKKPEGEYGRQLLEEMNERHGALFDWAFSDINQSQNIKILDVGCGGGGNILRLIKKYNPSYIEGVDYSETSIIKSRETLKEVYRVKWALTRGDVLKLPEKQNEFDLVTAIETIYFWEDPVKGLWEIHRVLKNGGMAAVVCEMNDPKKGKEWSRYTDGLRVYKRKDIEKMYEATGFKEIKGRDEGTWLCVTGIK